MNVRVQEQDLEGPDFFTGIVFAVDEIELGVNVLQAKLKKLKMSHGSKASVSVKITSEEISKVAGQIKMLADTLARASVDRINRRPRP